MDGSILAGEAQFLAGLERCGCNVHIEAELIIFDVTPIAGQYAGTQVSSGVNRSELGCWPSAPPHWIHFPAEITLSKTNSQPSTYANWLMHSRNVTNWGNAAEPAQAWLAHLRAVLEES